MYALIVVMALLAAAPQGLAEQDQGIPELTTEAAASVLLFEIEGLAPEDLSVERVVALHDRAKVYFQMRGRPYYAKFRCRATDFGATWGLEEDVERSIQPLQVESAAEPEAEQPAAEETEPATVNVPPEAESVLMPEGSGGYRAFLAQFVTLLRDGGRDSYAGYFYSDGDFNITQSEETPAESLARLQRRRHQFAATCSGISEELARFGEFQVSEIVATGISPAMMSDLQPLMPEVREFYNTAVVELLLDGRPGSITLEGVALVGGAWRVGGISGYAFPEPRD